MSTVSTDVAHRAWRRADLIRRLSDRLVGFGPVGIGLDGVLAWVPGLNVAYSVGAGALLMIEAVRCRADAWTLARMAGYLAFDAGTSEVPILGWAVDTLFPGQTFAARALQKHIESAHGRPPVAEPMRRTAFAAARG